jgi:hypothetical protein
MKSGICRTPSGCRGRTGIAKKGGFQLRRRAYGVLQTLRPMLRSLLAVVVCVAFAQSSNSATPPDFMWARTAAGSDYDAIMCVGVDQSGNCYIGGQFYSTVFNFGAITLTNRGGSDGYLSKCDPSGNLLWSRHYAGNGNDDVRQITFDQEGNVLIAGRFAGAVNFGATNLIGEGEDIFVAKVSIDGDCLWAVKAGGELEDFAESICVDGEGNCYIGGFIRSTNAVFGPFTLSVRTTNSPLSAA